MVEGADSGVECDVSDGARFLSESGIVATLLLSRDCLLLRRFWLAPDRCCCTGPVRYIDQRTQVAGLLNIRGFLWSLAHFRLLQSA